MGQSVDSLRLATARLVVRPYEQSDADAYLAACLRNQTHLHPFEQGNPALGLRTLDDASALLRRFAEDWASRRCLFLGAWERSDGTFVGQIYVGVEDRSARRFELGYWVDVTHEGQGYVTEAARAVIEWLFGALNAVEVRIGCNELNVRSQRVAERLGFERVEHVPHTRPHILLPDGTASGDYHYALSAAPRSQ